MDQYAQPVGEAELTAAAGWGTPAILKRMLESEDSLETSLRQDEAKKAECLAAVMKMAALRRNVERVRVLMAPPAHWGPVTPAVLNAGLQGAAVCIRQRYYDSKLWEMVQLLISAGADINTGDGALLMAAVQYHDADAISEIIKLGADVNVNKGAPLLAAAAIRENHTIFHTILQLGADATVCNGELLCQMMRDGSAWYVHQLLKRGASAGAWGPTLLQAAADQKQPEIVAQLLHAGIHLDSAPALSKQLFSLLLEQHSGGLLNVLAAQTTSTTAQVGHQVWVAARLDAGSGALE
jgi:hypothetical protein